MSEILVDIQNMSFKRDERVIYDDISLSIPTGKVTAIMGPSGIGKTTLLRLIGGQLKPTAGKITLWWIKLCVIELMLILKHELF